MVIQLAQGSPRVYQSEGSSPCSLQEKSQSYWDSLETNPHHYTRSFLGIILLLSFIPSPRSPVSFQYFFDKSKAFRFPLCNAARPAHFVSLKTIILTISEEE
jgi:hypothetical protein